MDSRVVVGAVVLTLVVVGVGFFSLQGGDEAVNPPEVRPAGIGDLPPPLDHGGRALQALAQHYEVGLVLCPIHAEGMVPRVYGTPRDAFRSLGPVYLIDIDPTQDAPWDPLYDVAFNFDGWAVFLAEPGSTSGMLRPYQRTLQLTWPAAVAGEQVACTAIEELPRRTLEGTTSGMDHPQYASTVGCGAPTPFTPDGTFSFQADVPCTLWAESRGFRSQEVVVEALPADESGQVPSMTGIHLNLEADPRFTFSGVTDLGREELLPVMTAELKRMELHLSALDGLLAQFEEDPKVYRQFGRWRTAQAEWIRKINGVIWTLENPPEIH